MPDFKKLAGRIGRSTADKAKTVASLAAKKTRNVSRIAKLNVDIAGERDLIKRTYSEIGKLYYETHREAPEDYFLQLCLEIDHALESIAVMESEIVRLKTSDLSPAGDESGPDVVVEIVDEADLAANDSPAGTRDGE